MRTNNPADDDKIPRIHRCVLMFSGGRDSTAAALRLAPICDELHLITITSEHLYGESAIYQRLGELEKVLPTKVHWQMFKQPQDLLTNTTSYAPTCLPCHHAYVAAGVKVAQNISASHLSFGYVSYQNSWPEQTPYATQQLAKLLLNYDLQLELPAYNITSKEEVMNILSKAGVSTAALEQKCTRQINNVELPAETLRAEITMWESLIQSTLERVGSINLESMDERLLNTTYETERATYI